MTQFHIKTYKYRPETLKNIYLYNEIISKMSDFNHKINRILVEIIVHVHAQKILQCDHSLV